MPNFATVNQLARHIEILLLSNDCVIVPSLGGFVAHHICARYVPDEGLFLPPLRTIGFNPQLTLNDSLLAQSYALAAGTSLPDALNLIEADVRRLRHALDEQGEVELCSLGRLYKNADGQLAFEPCEAGILTPSLYGLSSFELRQLQGGQAITASEPAATDNQSIASRPTANHAFPTHTDADNGANDHEAATSPRIVSITSDPSGRKTLNISMRALRYAAAAAAVIAALVLLPVATVSQFGHTTTESRMFGGIDTAIKQLTATDSPTPPSPSTAKPSQSEATANQAAPTANQATATPSHADTQAATPVQPQASVTTPSQDGASTESYTLVLCSHVSQAGAEYFVQKVAANGINGAEISTATGSVKVLFGHYPTQAEAQQALNRLQSNPHFKQAWVMKEK